MGKQKPKITFYGFDWDTTEELRKIAEDAGLDPLNGVSKHLKCIVVSPEVLNSRMMSKEEFLREIHNPEFTAPTYAAKKYDTICFTGFDDKEKAELQKIAADAGIRVAKGYSQSLGLLVAGPKAGPKKLRLAEEYNTKILNKDAFLQMLQNGDTPETVEPASIEAAINIGDKIDVPPGVFVAIDFETADHKPDSACAVGVVRVEDGVVVAEMSRLIRPPRERVRNTHVHGLDWNALRDHPPFQEAWKDVAPLFDDAQYIIAHNAYFDRVVMETCCNVFGVQPPSSPFICTLKGAKTVVKEGHYSLNDLCARFSIPLEHHKALSDAKAAMRIFEELHRNGLNLADALMPPVESFQETSPKTSASVKQEVGDAAREFKIIVDSLACDEALTQGEFDYICQWLTNHDDLSEANDFQPVFELAAEILQDGVVATDEREKMLELLNVLFTD